MKADLYYKDDVSDKEYHIEMLPQGSGFVVNVAYGRVGANLIEGTKTVNPVSQSEAQKIFNTLVRSKEAKGYVRSGTAGKQQVQVTQVQVTKGIAPMLCTKMLPEEAENLSDEWVMENKFDGVRAVIRDGKLWCRRGNEITSRFPEFVGLEKLKQCYDGEIIAQSGEFNDISGRMHLRDKFQINLRSKKSPAIFMAFDLPDAQGDNEARREMLVKTKCPQWMQIAEQFEMGDFKELWTNILENNLEGVVVKRKDARYVQGSRSNGWKKVKAFQETTATFTSYEVHPRGIKMMTADERTVNVNGEQAKGVKDAIDTKGFVKAEIQYLPQKDSDAWRFPSFRGVV